MNKTPDQIETALQKALAALPKKGLGTNRGIETLFRSVYRVQMDLTALADNKANIMISINGIIITVIIAAVAPKLDANPALLIPSTFFLIGTLVSIIFAILAARPRVQSNFMSLKDLKNNHGNILYFGDFANLDQDDFTLGMIELIQDRSAIYETMIRNIYGLGKILRRKFFLLKVAYTAFMIALLLGVLSFVGILYWILPANIAV